MAAQKTEVLDIDSNLNSFVIRKDVVENKVVGIFNSGAQLAVNITLHFDKTKQVKGGEKSFEFERKTTSSLLTSSYEEILNTHNIEYSVKSLNLSKSLGKYAHLNNAFIFEFKDPTQCKIYPFHNETPSDIKEMLVNDVVSNNEIKRNNFDVKIYDKRENSFKFQITADKLPVTNFHLSLYDNLTISFLMKE